MNMKLKYTTQLSLSFSIISKKDSNPQHSVTEQRTFQPSIIISITSDSLISTGLIRLLEVVVLGLAGLLLLLLAVMILVIVVVVIMCVRKKKRRDSIKIACSQQSTA